MYAFISGNIVELEPTHVVLDNQGIGYELKISLTTYTGIKGKENCRLWTHFYVKEDQQSLFGFEHKAERELFQLLISISGVGPSTAVMVLSSLSPSEVVDAILMEQVNVIQGVKGIGAKTAQRLILELKDKVGKLGFTGVGEIPAINDNNVKEQSLLALQALGINKAMAQKSVDKILKSNPDLSVEDVIKQALKQK